MTTKYTTSGSSERQKEFTTAYAAVMDYTDKQARHWAVDIDSLAKAREGQRKFASRVNKLCKLLARDFPGHELHFTYAKTESARATLRTGVFHVAIWLLDGTTIKRSIFIHGTGRFVSAVVEQTVWPSEGCDIRLGVESLTHVRGSITWAPCLRAIKETPFQVHAA